MKNIIYKLLLLNLVNTSLCMEPVTISKSVSKQVALTETQQRKIAQYNIIQKVAKTPALLNDAKYRAALPHMDSDIIQKMIVGNWIPKFTPIFIEKSTPEKFLEVIHGNKNIFEQPEFQQKFYSLHKEKILDFVSRSENKELLDTIAKNAPDKLFKYLHNFGNKNFVESKYAIERKATETQESGLIKVAVLPFVTLKNISTKALEAIVSYFYGTEKVSKSTERAIRNIAQDRWSTQNFIIRKIDPQILKLDPNTPPFTVANCLFINENHFNSLSETERRSVITHELGHINSGHSNKRLLYLGADLASSGINIAITGVHIKQAFSAKSNLERFNLLKSQGFYTTVGLGIKHLLHKEMLKTSYKQEFEADRYAALHTGNNELIDYLEANTSTENLNISTTTHPAAKSRIEYIKTISQKSYINSAPVIETTTFIRLPQGGIKNIAEEIGQLVLAPYKISLHKHQACGVSEIAFLGAAPVFVATLPPAGVVVVGTVAVIGASIVAVKTVELAIQYGPDAAAFLAECFSGNKNNIPKLRNKDKNSNQENKKHKNPKGPKGPKKPDNDPNSPVGKIITAAAAKKAADEAEKAIKDGTAKAIADAVAKNGKVTVSKITGMLKKQAQKCADLLKRTKFKDTGKPPRQCYPKNLDPNSCSGAPKVEAWAIKKYDDIRKANDVGKIAENTGLPRKLIEKAKDHVFYKKHNVRIDINANGQEIFAPGRFHPDYKIASAWDRLTKGDHTRNDIQLLFHEAMESKLMNKGINSTDAHSILQKTTEFHWNWFL